MKVTYNIKKNCFILKSGKKFPQRTYQNIKFIENMKQVRTNKITIPHTETNIGILKTLSGFKWSDLAFQHLYIENKEKAEQNIKGLNHDLFAFQKKGVGFFFSNKGRGVCCDEMGLGKTIQSLAWCNQQDKLTLIVCPSSVKYNWEKEIKFWLKDNKKVFVVSGRKPEPIPEKVNYIIINYDILSHRYNELAKLAIEIIILDEFHYIKESSTKRTQAVKKLCKKKKHIIGLSGTPIKSRPVEFFNILHIINPIMFPSFWKFAHKYCGAKHNGFGWDFKGATKTEELNLLLKGTMIRRLKKDVIKDLPDKIRSIVPLEITNKAEYNKAKKDFLTYTLKKKGIEKAKSASKAETLVKKGVLKQLAIQGKMNGIIEWLVDFLDENSDDKIIVFAIHKKTIAELKSHFNKVAVVLDGSTTAKNRIEMVDKFQKDKKIRMFIGNLQSAGTGITLTASSTICFLEVDYLPNEYLQAEDRAHRIGQINCVNIYYFLGIDTIDEEIMIDILNPKMRIFNQIIDGKSQKDTNIFEALMKEKNNENIL